MSIRYEPSVMGASFYQDERLLCLVSGMEDAIRLMELIQSKDNRIGALEDALRGLVDAVKSMDMQKQKEAIRLSEKVLGKEQKSLR